jgi:hypothetical protein
MAGHTTIANGSTGLAVRTILNTELVELFGENAKAMVSVPTSEDMLNIPLEYLADGKLCFVVEDKTVYQYTVVGTVWAQIAQVILATTITADGPALIGAGASSTNFPATTTVNSKGQSGHTSPTNTGVVGESAASALVVGVGVCGSSKTSSAKEARGVAGIGKVNDTTDSVSSVGVFARAIDTHAGGSNIAVFANASAGANNYSFYGYDGKLHNEGDVTTAGAVTATGDVTGDNVAGATVTATGLSKGGTGHFGGAANYSEFEADGTLKFNGDATVWKDLITSASNLRSGGSPPTFAQFLNGVYGYRFDAGTADELHGSFELQHDYKEGTDLDFHVHWSPTTTNNGNVVWGVEYTVQNIAGVFPATTTVTMTPTAAGGVANAHKLHDIAIITGTGLKIGAVIVYRVFRQNGGTDTFTGNAFLHSVGIHYQCDTVGSRQELVK